MKLYEILGTLEEVIINGCCVNEDTGEYFDPSDLEALELDAKSKLEGVFLCSKGFLSEAEAIKAEEAVLAERRRTLEHKAENLRGYGDKCMQRMGLSHFKTPRCVATYRKSTTVDVTPAFWENRDAKFIRQKPPEADKTAIRAAIRGGLIVPGAELVERVTLSIK